MNVERIQFSYRFYTCVLVNVNVAVFVWGGLSELIFTKT